MIPPQTPQSAVTIPPCRLPQFHRYRDSSAFHALTIGLLFLFTKSWHLCCITALIFSEIMFSVHVLLYSNILSHCWLASASGLLKIL